MELAAIRALCDWARAGHGGVRIAFITDGLPRRRQITWPSQLQSDYADLDTVAFAYDGDIDLLVSRIADAHLVFTTKLHVGIVAASLGRPVISVPHHPKTRRFFRQIDAERLVVDQDRADWQANVRALLDELSSVNSMAFERLSELRQQNDYEALIRNFIASVSKQNR